MRPSKQWLCDLRRDFASGKARSLVESAVHVPVNTCGWKRLVAAVCWASLDACWGCSNSEACKGMTGAAEAFGRGMT